MSKNNFSWSNDKSKHKAAGIHEVDLMTTIATKVDALAKMVDGMAISQVSQYTPVDTFADNVSHN